MRVEDVRKRLRQEPFSPFRMHLTDGSAYEVRHAGLVMLGRRSLVLGLTAQPEDTLYQTTVDIDLMHIVRMDAVDSQRSRRRRNGD